MTTTTITNKGKMLVHIADYVNHEIHDPQHGPHPVLSRYHEIVLEGVTLRATDDGNRNIPSSIGTDVSRIEISLVDPYKTKLKTISTRSSAYYQQVKDRLEEQKQEIENKQYHHHASQTYDEYQRKIDACEDQIRENESRIKEIISNFNYVCRKYERKTGQLDGSKLLILNPLIYGTILVVLGLLDGYYNATSLFYHDFTTWKAITVAGLCGLAVTFTTHVIGHAFKKGKRLLAFLLLPFLLALLGVFPALLNWEAFSSEKGESYISSDYYSTEVDETETTEEIAFFSPIFWVLAGTTTLLIIGGIVLAYNATDSEEEFEKNYKLKETKIPELEMTNVTLSKESRDLSREQSREVNEIKSAQMTQADHDEIASYEENIAMGNALAQSYNSVSELAEKFAEMAITVYRNTNEKARSDSPPAIWKKTPMVDKFDRLEFFKNGILKLYKNN